MGRVVGGKWFKRYLMVVIPAIAVFFIPKILVEYFAIGDLNFRIKEASSTLFASRWLHFVAMFVLFEVVGIYIVVSGWMMRRIFLTVPERLAVYGVEFAVLTVATILLIFDLISGQSMAGSNMIGAGNMEGALKGYVVHLTQSNAFDALTVMHVIFTTGSVAYTLTAISNYAISGIFEDRTEDNSVIEERREAFYRTLYASTALLTVGVLQLAAWLGLPTDNIEQKEEFTKLVTAMTIYLSMLFTLIAIVSAYLSASCFNRSVSVSVPDRKRREELQIKIFDRKMIISMFLPAIAGYLVKLVPLLFA
ncbi:membrane hypothetical protein [Agrobacterium fabacearum CFBP 5771]|nr:membrane hypothetical protein [Agrobacterium fabacearum CFBP 5771]